MKTLCNGILKSLWLCFNWKTFLLVCLKYANGLSCLRVPPTIKRKNSITRGNFSQVFVLPHSVFWARRHDKASWSQYIHSVYNVQCWWCHRRCKYFHSNSSEPSSWMVQSMSRARENDERWAQLYERKHSIFHCCYRWKTIRNKLLKTFKTNAIFHHDESLFFHGIFLSSQKAATRNLCILDDVVKK